MYANILCLITFAFITAHAADELRNSTERKWPIYVLPVHGA